MDIKAQVKSALEAVLNCPVSAATNEQIYYALLTVIRNHIAGRKQEVANRKVYYISSEFLIGKLLSNNLINLSLYDHTRDMLVENGKSLTEIENLEPEPSLGNGGLGRLAACFLDSIATLDIPGDGISLKYQYGLFRQKFKENSQFEEPNPWIKGFDWLRKTDTTYTVEFGGFSVNSRLYEIDVVGYHNNRVNKLCLFDVETLDPSIVKDGINFDKNEIAKNLTLFLYPDDSDEAGHLLRIYQQYFMVANGVNYILDEIKNNGVALSELHKHAVIQINDTHPTLVIPELIRQLVARGIKLDDAIEIVKNTTAYTNHTILAEALEKWPLHYLEKVVPHLIDIIKYLDKQVRDKYNDSSVAIIDDSGRVHMAHIAIHYGFSVNGVAALHTEILKNSELNHFYKIYPEKFNNKTNGITFRRWLQETNPELTDYISELITRKFKDDATELEKLLPFKDDAKVLNTLATIKHTKKKQFAEFIKGWQGIDVNPDSIFDVQIKRIHEYKRQQMNMLYIIHKYLEVKAGKLPIRPITFVFGGKAAPAYIIAKHVIHTILCLQEIINNDPEANKYLKVVYVENYNVSVAERLIPAADISEQISLASKEASGTGNMKFMLNGAVTLGTMDGANVEIAELVGKDNIYTFGKDSDTIIELYRTSGYHSRSYYENSQVIKAAVDFIISPAMLKAGNEEKLNRLHAELLNKDWFMTLIDLEEYIKIKDRVLADYENQSAWQRKCLINIAKAGFFSSDRTIGEYNRDIWKI